MAVEDLNDSNFQEKLDAAEMAVVDFYASWCGPCILLKPKYQKLSERFPHVAFFICDGERAPEARKTVHIETLPYFGLYRSGTFVEGFSTATVEGVTEHLEAAFGAPAGPAAGPGEDE